MKPPKLQLITDFDEAKWVQVALYPWDDIHIACLGVFIPVGFESYLAIRHDNSDPALGSTVPLNFERPNLMWPKDKSWFISNEIDYDVTLVGGSEEMIREIENFPYFITERFDPAVPNYGIYRADWML